MCETGEELKRYLELKKIPVACLARELDVSERTVFRWFKDDTFSVKQGYSIEYALNRLEYLDEPDDSVEVSALAMGAIKEFIFDAYFGVDPQHRGALGPDAICEAFGKIEGGVSKKWIKEWSKNNLKEMIDLVGVQ